MVAQEDRVILHCDLNNFYASVECSLNPALQGVPVAVSGNPQERHGIILAKNELAKAAGVRTAETIWQAKRKCPDLVTVPPHFEQYYRFSRAARAIYGRYTDQIEPFGIDECWLDVTGSTGLFGSGEEIAHQLRAAVRQELGVTISVGASFNKVFAKLGSDLKKPDAVTVIRREDFRRILWPLPVGQMLGVGRATGKVLDEMGVYTIGQLAELQMDALSGRLGKNGAQLWQYANGFDKSPVAREGEITDVKSMGNSLTCSHDLTTPEEVWQMLLLMAESVSHRLRKERLLAGGVVLCIKDARFRYTERSQRLPLPCRSAMDLAEAAMRLFQASYGWRESVRAVGVRATALEVEDAVQQISLFEAQGADLAKRELIDSRMDLLRQKFGSGIIKRAVLMQVNQDVKHHGTDDAPMPTFHSR